MLPICAEPAVIVQVSDRTEHRIRFVEGAPLASDLANVPSINVGIHHRRYDGWLSTYPLFAIHDFQSENARGVLAMAQGSTGFSWHDRRLQLVVSESASYGLQNFAYLLPLNLPPGQTAPPTTPVPTSNGDFLFSNSQSLASLNYRWSRRFSTFVSPTFTIGGGVEDKQHPELSPTQYIPFQVTPRIDVRLDYHWSRTTRLQTLAGAYTSQFDDRRCDYRTGGSPTPETSQKNAYGICKSEGQEAEIEERWRHSISKTTEIGLGAGGSIVRTRIDAVDFGGARLPSPVPDRTRFFPVVAAQFSHRFSWHRPEISRIEIDARLGPFMDIRFGYIDPRVSVAIRDISYYKKTRIKGSIELAQTMPPDEPISTTFVQGDLEALYRLGRRFDVGGGIRFAWQRYKAPNGQDFPFTTIIAYGAVLFHEPAFYLAGGHPSGILREPRPEL